MRKGLYIVLAVLTVAIAFGACGKEEVDAVNEPDVTANSRGAGMNDSTESDSGKVRIGDIVIDTAWAGETHIYF